MGICVILNWEALVFMHIHTLLLSGFGIIFLLLGAIGAFIPVFPTTPFVLLGIACLGGTPKLRNQVLKIKLFREYFENFQNRKGLSKQTVTTSLVWLWGMMFLSIFITKKLWLALLLIAIGLCVTVHILHMARPKRGMKNE